MLKKVNKAPIIAASQGATSSTKATPATSPKAGENGHSALIAVRRDALGRFLSKNSKPTKAPRKAV